MPNKHQEHPEDLLLTGEVWPVDAMFSESHTSLKIDGAPAVVFGTHPHNGKFFVGTKSVFNKRQIKINYSYNDICKNHPQDNVRQILSACLSYLPRVSGVFQGDFIGFGGKTSYTPNTLTYTFPEVVQANIIIAPHTEYYIRGEMWNAEAQPLMDEFTNTPQVLWVQPFIDRVPLEDAWHIDVDKVNFLSDKEASQAKVAINALIRSGQELDIQTLTDIIGDSQLAHIYKLVIALKNDYLNNTVVYNSPVCTLNGERILGEGLSVTTEDGMFKVVDREAFSYANFNVGKFQ